MQDHSVFCISCKTGKVIHLKWTVSLRAVALFGRSNSLLHSITLYITFQFAHWINEVNNINDQEQHNAFANDVQYSIVKTWIFQFVASE